MSATLANNITETNRPEKTYSIYDGYTHRTMISYYNDTENSDEWQKEVYQIARLLFDKYSLKSVFDFGCGSGFKLLQNFSDADIIGVDLEPTVQFLKKEYPEHSWHVSDFNAPPVDSVDLIICSDIIEHLLDPDELLAYINKIDSQFIVFSTPCRDLLPVGKDGPPFNPAHVREWNQAEFNDYIGKHFDIIYQSISNPFQATQLVICKRRL